MYITRKVSLPVLRYIIVRNPFTEPLNRNGPVSEFVWQYLGNRHTNLSKHENTKLKPVEQQLESAFEVRSNVFDSWS